MNRQLLLVAGLVVVLAAVGVYMTFGHSNRPKHISNEEEDDDGGATQDDSLTVDAASLMQAQAGGSTSGKSEDAPMFITNEPIDPTMTLPPDRVVKKFAFEPYGRPLIIPTVQGRLGRKAAGTPPFNLVQCDLLGGYAIRWNYKYFTLKDANTMEWTEDKQEPHSCWRIVPGYCGNEGYVMLRSLANNQFLTYDTASDALVCRDIPTGRTAKQYCWKLTPDAATQGPCGCQYDYKLGRVVCKPCNVKKMPDGNESCSTVTLGYQAECCVAKRWGSQSDPFCRTAAWPEVIGRSVQEAMLFLRTRRPDLVLQPCPSPCSVSAYPEPKQNIIVIPYDPRTGTVTAAARRLV